MSLGLGQILMALKSRFRRGLVGVCLITLGWLCLTTPAWAAVDGYVIQYLKAAEPVQIAIDAQGNTREFDATQFTEGLRLFEDNCNSCHVGGTTRQNGTVSLSLKDLQAATPPRTNTEALVAFQRMPMSYDGSEEVYWCRQISPKWLSDEQLTNLAAFLVRSAEVVPDWGTVILEKS